MPNDAVITAVTQSDSPLTQQAVWLSQYQYGLRLSEQGTVISVGDGIAWINGLTPRILIARFKL